MATLDSNIEKSLYKISTIIHDSKNLTTIFEGLSKGFSDHYKKKREVRSKMFDN